MEVIGNGMKYLILGANGQLGSEFCEALTEKNLGYKAHTKTQLDILDFQRVRDEIRIKQPEFIINTAAWTDVRGAETNLFSAYRINAEAVGNLALTAKEFGSKLIHFSSDYVFSGENNKPFDEDDPKRPVNFYGYSKLAGENRIIDLMGTDFYIFRTAWLYGSSGKNFLTSILQIALETKDNVDVVNDQCGQPTSVQELARTVIDACERNLSSGLYNLTNSGNATWYEFAREIFYLSGEDSDRVVAICTSERKDSVNRPSYSVMSNNKWISAGMVPMEDWREALGKVIPKAISFLKSGKNEN